MEVPTRQFKFTPPWANEQRDEGTVSIDVVHGLRGHAAGILEGGGDGSLEAVALGVGRRDVVGIAAGSVARQLAVHPRPCTLPKLIYSLF